MGVLAGLLLVAVLIKVSYQLVAPEDMLDVVLVTGLESVVHVANNKGKVCCRIDLHAGLRQSF